MKNMETTLIYILLSTMVFNSVNGQNLNGKWILKELKDINYTVSKNKKTAAYPGFQLLEINNSTGLLYTDFSLEEQPLHLKIIDSTIVTSNNKKHSDYKLVNENHLKLFMEGKMNGKDTVFEINYYRLEPTITTLKKEDIEKLTFVLVDDKENSEFIFTKKLGNNQGVQKMIEQIDFTFFVSLFNNGERSVSFIIKEVSPELLKLYAIPTGPMEMIAYRKK